ncbi:hypothetical protein EYZ11_011811 [Aspergillus tanneri]|uniref:PLAC8 family protein n=1 Tax=Aspergillus tanneri TaxID=1220188 RepID=A0A4S3J3Z2_9EURO|nr:hypothetical protein EYZ11_011811 [Aspergillus tanneri]
MGTPAQEQQQEQSREWSNSLWGCCSPAGTCFTACCCPCLLFGKTQSRMEDPALKEYSHMNGDCCLFTLAGYFGLSGILLMLKRGEMRKRFGIEGNGCTDCLVACCFLIYQRQLILYKTRYLNYPSSIY